MQIKKIVFTGPECAGKTTICSAIAAQLQVDWVQEYARKYLEEINRPYVEQDLLTIAKGQKELERVVATNNNGLLLCDTSLLVIKIWSLVKYGKCHSWIEEQLKNDLTTLYFLCAPDIPWEADPLRESPHEREKLLLLYKQELEKMKKPYILLRGSETQRKQEVLSILAIYNFGK